MAQPMVDRQGRIVEIPDDEVQAAYFSGQYAFPKGSRINVASEDGTVYAVDASQAEAVFKDGYRPATQAEVKTDLDRQRYDTTLGAVAAAGEGAARGATLGLSDPIAIETARAFGGEGAAEATREHLEGVQRFNPTAAMLGEIGGAAAPLLVTGGTSAAATGTARAAQAARAGVRAVGAPVRAADALGALAERGVARAIGTEGATVGRRVAQAGARWGARGAVEGAAWEAGMAVSEAALGDTELTGERLLAALGEGALVGGVAGGAIGATGRAGLEGARATGRGIQAGYQYTAEQARRGIQWGTVQAQEMAEGVESLARRMWGDAAPGLGERWVQLQSALTGADPEAIRKLGIQNTTPEAMAARKLVTFGADEAHNTAVRTIRKSIDWLVDRARAISEHARGGLKIDHVRKIVVRGNEDATHRAAYRYLDGLKKNVNEMLAERGAYGQRASLLQAREAINHYETRIAKRVSEGVFDNAELFADLDHLKQRIGKWSGPDRHIVSADQATHARMREHYDGVRGLLESERLWGAAGKAQREINEGWVRWLDTLERFERTFMIVGEKDAATDYWTRKMVADPAKVDAHLNNIGLVRQDAVKELLEAHVDNTIQFADSIVRNYGIPKDQLLPIQEIRSAAESLRKSVKSAEDTVGLVNQMKALVAADTQGAGAGLMGLAGGVFAGPVGAAAGLASGALMQPGRSIRQMAVLESMAGKLTERVEGGVQGFISKAKERAKEVTEKGVAKAREIAKEVADTTKRAAKATADATVRGSVATARGTYRAGIYAGSEAARERRRRYERIASTVQMAASHPEAVSRAVYASLGPAADSAPMAAAATAQAANRAMGFLATKLPPQGPSRNPLQPELDVPRVSDTEMSRFLRYAKAVESPTSVLSDLANGTLSREGVESLRVVYPKVYEQIQSEILANMGAIHDRLAYSDRIQLGILFNVPTDVSLQPEFIALMQSQFMVQDGPDGMPQVSGSSIDIAKDFATEAERVAAS